MSFKSAMTVGFGALALAAATGTAEAQQRGEECRVEEMDPRRGPARQTFCRNRDGQWRPRPDLDAAAASGRPATPVAAPGVPAASVLPADWRGTITYSGTHEGYVQQAGPGMRDLSVGSVVGAVAGGQRQRYAGRYDLVLTIDGASVTGQASGTGGIEPATFSGVRTGSLCRMFLEGAEVEATCTSDRFVGVSRSPRGASPSFMMNIDARAVKVVDAAEEERQRAEAAERAREDRVATESRGYDTAAARQMYDLAGSCMVRFDHEMSFSPELEGELKSAYGDLMLFAIFAGQEAGLSEAEIPVAFMNAAPSVDDRFRDRAKWDEAMSTCRELATRLRS